MDQLGHRPKEMQKVAVHGLWNNWYKTPRNLCSFSPEREWRWRKKAAENSHSGWSLISQSRWKAEEDTRISSCMWTFFVETGAEGCISDHIARNSRGSSCRLLWQLIQDHIPHKEHSLWVWWSCGMIWLFWWAGSGLCVPSTFGGLCKLYSCLSFQLITHHESG